ncbi:hypothetical protein PG989_011737 [Apiospora arundinis]
MDSERLDDIHTSQRIVRMYSQAVDGRITKENAAYALSQILIADRGRAQDMDPWRRFFEWQDDDGSEPEQIVKILRIESSNLKKKWAVFYEGCSHDDRLDLHSSEPSIEGVLEVVKRIEHDWESHRRDTRSGRATHMFHRFCRGTLSVILKASANHERVIEGLSAAITTITDHVRECKVEQELYKTGEMKEAVANLYADIFLLLSNIMEYLTKKRFKRLLDSFNEDLYKRFEDQISNISTKVMKIQRLADQGFKAEIRVIRLQLESLERNVIAGQEGEARLIAELIAANNRKDAELLEAIKQRDHSAQRQSMEYLATNLNRMLGAEALEAVKGIRSAARSVNLASSLPLEYITGLSVLPPGAAPVLTDSSYMADDLLLQSKQFENFFDRGRVRLSGLQLRPVMQTDHVIRRLSDWTNADPSILWLEGPATPLRDEYNPLTTIAARVVELADQAKANIISYFCHRPRGEHLRPGNTTSEAQASVALITALTRQAMELLLPRFESKLNLSEVRLSLVKGTMESLPETLRLFGDLLETLDMQLLCVIDGLHWLDDRGTTTILVDLVKMLRNSSAKVLFTTTGRSACLQSEIEWANSRVEGQFAMR